MIEIPTDLLRSLLPADKNALAEWWAKLDDQAKSEVVTLCDTQNDKCFFGAVITDSGAPIPVVIGGQFVPNDNAAGWAEWHAKVLDYLVCHPELACSTPPVVRTFHICTRHETARAAVSMGTIPDSFRCPFEAEQCPLLTILMHSAIHRLSL